MHLTRICALLLGILLQLAPQSTDAQGKRLFVAHYNVENLFDTINDPKIQDEEFLPESESKWTGERYTQKLSQLSKVIESMNGGMGPHILGLCEVENAGVVADLAKKASNKKRKYAYVHFDSPDGRGIDVAMLYQPKFLKVTASQSLRVVLPGEGSRPTRDVLVVSGRLPNKQVVHILVNHWPSRRGGQDDSETARMAAAAVVRRAVDSLHRLHPTSVVMVMGDFNDAPTDKAPREVLGADWPVNQQTTLGNPFLPLSGDSTQGSYRYRNNWQYIDHISISPSAFNGKAKVQYVSGSAGACLQPWQLEQEGRFKGNPFRTYAGTRYLGGFSDHLPVKIELEWRK